jgi:hypothetical protein
MPVRPLENAASPIAWKRVMTLAAGAPVFVNSASMGTKYDLPMSLRPWTNVSV